MTVRRGRPSLAERVRALGDPVVTTPRLELRQLDPRRVEEIVPLLNEAEIARWTLKIPSPYRLADAREYFRELPRRRRSGRLLSLHIVRRPDRALIGGIALTDIDPDHLRAEIGYWLGLPFRGEGYAREAVRALTEFGFRSLGLHRIEAGVFPGNRASLNVLRACGFRREGRMRHTVRKNGTPRDVLLYARLSDDPPLRAGSGRPTR